MHRLTGARPASARTRVRATLAGAALLAAWVLVPSMAWAHVTVQPDEVEGGGFAVVTFRVPTERAGASTTQLQVLLPEEKPVASVRTRPVPGWKVATKSRTLAEPIDLHGEELDTVVADVTWTATGPGIAPGQFEDFDLSMGPLPESGEVVFTAIQTYSSGEVVKWNEVAVDDAAELEHPAPVLTVTAPAGRGTDADGPDSPAATTGPTADDDASTLLPVGLSALALVVALAALVVAARRRR